MYRRASDEQEASPATLSRADGEAEFWQSHLFTGVLMYLAGTVLSAGYLAATPDGPNRSALWWMVAIGALSVVAILLVPRQAILDTSRRLTFFVGWSLFTAPFTAVVAWLDGGLSSPMALLLIMPMLYAALAYPVRWVAVVGSTTLVAASVVALATQAEASMTVMYIGSLGIIGSATAFTAARRENQDARLMMMATHDSLTGCLDHHTFYERLERILAAPDRPEVAVAVIDLDKFKSVNDQHGHLTGDELLRSIGSILRSVTRVGDLVGRIGGDEFAVCFVGAQVSVAEAAGERVNSELAAVDLPVRTRVSVGLAAAGPYRSVTARGLVRQADEAMFRQKAAHAQLRSVN